MEGRQIFTVAKKRIKMNSVLLRVGEPSSLCDFHPREITARLPQRFISGKRFQDLHLGKG